MDSISQHFVYRNIQNFDVLQRKCLLSLYKRIIFSENELVITLVNSVHFLYSGFMSNFFKTLYVM